MSSTKSAPDRPDRKKISRAFHERATGVPLTFGKLLNLVRMREELTLDGMSKLLGISRGNLCDIEHGRRAVSAQRAARWADLLGYEVPLFVELAIQAELEALGLPYRVTVEAA